MDISVEDRANELIIEAKEIILYKSQNPELMAEQAVLSWLKKKSILGAHFEEMMMDTFLDLAWWSKWVFVKRVRDVPSHVQIRINDIVEDILDQQEKNAEKVKSIFG